MNPLSLRDLAAGILSAPQPIGNTTMLSQRTARSIISLPAVASLTLALGLALTAGGCGNNPYPHKIQGDNAMQGSRWAEAVTEYNEYLSAKPESPAVRANLGRAYLNNKQYVEAIEQLRIASLQDPEAGIYLDWLGDAYIGADRTDDAYRLFRNLTRENGRVSDWLRLGRYSMKAGDMDTAQQAFITAARVDRGRTAAPQVALYDYYTSLNNNREAENRLRMAYFCDPQDSDVTRGLKASGLTGGPGFGYVPTERIKSD